MGSTWAEAPGHYSPELQLAFKKGSLEQAKIDLEERKKIFEETIELRALEGAERELRERPPQNPNASKPLNLTREERQSLKYYIERAVLPVDCGSGTEKVFDEVDLRTIYFKLTGVSLSAHKTIWRPSFGARKTLGDVIDPHFGVDVSDLVSPSKSIHHIDGHEVEKPTKKVQFPNSGIDQ